MDKDYLKNLHSFYGVEEDFDTWYNNIKNEKMNKILKQITNWFLKLINFLKSDLFLFNKIKINNIKGLNKDVYK